MSKLKLLFLFVAIFVLTACDSNESGSGGASPSSAANSKSGSDSRVAATAEEVAEEGRGKVKCPAKIKSSPRAGNAPVIDVVGVYPGLSYEEAANLVMCTNDLLVAQLDNSRRFDIKTFGQTLRQGFSAKFAKPKINKTSKEIMQEMQYGTTSSGTNRAGQDVELGESKWFVGTMGMPGQEKVYSAAREEWFVENGQPTMASVEQALIKKYGTPTNNRDGGGVQRVITWSYDPLGRPLSESSPLFFNCRGVFDPDSGVSLQPECGIIIMANIVALRSNPELAEYIQVGVLDSANGYQTLMDTEQQLQAMENQRRSEQVKDAAKNASGPQL